MTSPDTTRRHFLRTSGAAVGGSWIVLSFPALMSACRAAEEARTGGGALQTLQPDEASAFEAMAARIVPSGDEPGAREAGVIHFMDRVLGAVRSDALEPMRQGLAGLQAQASSTFGGASFESLTERQQDTLLTGIEETEFFLTVRYLTLAGMFSLPEHGGNRDGVGWRLLGFDGRQAWQPPFGYYDADYAEKGE